MNRPEIVAALAALAARLDARGLEADLYVVGGPAIALAYDARRATRDIDAIFAPKAEVYVEAARVADDLELPPDWLNDAVKGFLLGPDPGPMEILQWPGLRVEVASPGVVLVMRCLAHRLGEDDDDVRLLAGQLDLDAAGVLDLVATMAGERLLTPSVALFVEEILAP